jgi:hypothetical protein
MEDLDERTLPFRFCQYAVFYSSIFLSIFSLFTFQHTLVVHRYILSSWEEGRRERVRESVLFCCSSSSTSLFLITFHKCNSHLSLSPPFLCFFFSFVDVWHFLAHPHAYNKKKTTLDYWPCFETARTFYFSIKI